MRLGSVLLWSIGGYFLFKAWKKGSGYAHFYEQMNYYIRGRIHKINLSGITVKADIEIHNPTEVKITITKPTVRVYSNNIEIGHSNPENIKIDIKPMAVTNIPTIDLQLPWSTELGKIVVNAGSSAAALIAGGTVDKIGINVEVKSLFNVDGMKNIIQSNKIEL